MPGQVPSYKLPPPPPPLKDLDHIYYEELSKEAFAALIALNNVHENLHKSVNENMFSFTFYANLYAFVTLLFLLRFS